MSDRITPMSASHAEAAASLHRIAIHTGFLSRLGPAFLRQLYAAIPSCPSGFGYVREEPEGEIAGFIACAESVGELYRQALLRRGVLMAIPLVRFLVRPSVVRRMIQTLLYPSRTARRGLPDAEILSIVVSQRFRRKGLGRALMDAATNEFARRGIDCVKVAVWAGNEPANRFYRGCGFELAATREHHGLGMNVYTLSLPVGTPGPTRP